MSRLYMSRYKLSLGCVIWFAAGSHEGRGYKPTIWERQSPLLSKTHLGLKSEDTHSRSGKMVLIKKKLIGVRIWIVTVFTGDFNATTQIKRKVKFLELHHILQLFELH